jgi:hypothetical protein
MMTIGLPGSGLSYRQSLGRGRKIPATEPGLSFLPMAMIIVIWVFVVAWFLGG